MADIVTKEDLQQFGLKMMNDFRIAMQELLPVTSGTQPEWLKSKVVRKLLDISPASLQSLRITGSIKFKKVLGSYYYKRTDIEKLFTDE